MRDWNFTLNPFSNRGYVQLERSDRRESQRLERSSTEVAQAQLRIAAALKAPEKGSPEAKITNLETLTSYVAKVSALAKGFFDPTATITRESKELAELRTSLLGSHMLASDWEDRQAVETYVNKDTNAASLPDSPVSEPSGKFSVYKEHFYRAAETGGNVGGILSGVTSVLSSFIKVVTSVVSPLSTAVPFIGLFNGLMNGFQFGKGVDRLHFYNALARELRPASYDPVKRNFGPYSERLLSRFPHLKEIDIAPNRLLRLLQSEVARKRIKYSFYLVSKALGFGASVVGFLGGLAAFSAPVFAFPALFLGLPLALGAIIVGYLGNYISARMRDPLLVSPQAEKTALTND